MHPKYARLVRRSPEPQNNKIQRKKLFFLKPKFLRRVLGILILLVAVSWSFQYWIPSSKAYATPWSPTHGSYGQRKQLTLVNNSGQTFESGSTYKVSIDTASLYNTGSLLSSCDDLRVVYQPSNTTATELKRAVEYASSSSGVTTCGTSSATKVVFQLQADMSNGSNTSNYYLYYDNATATTYPSADALAAYNVGAKTATFVAPFNGTTTALAAGSGTPTTATGAIRYSGGKSALSFDGKNDYLTHTGSLIGGTHPYTAELWANFSSVTADQMIFGTYNNGGLYWDGSRFNVNAPVGYSCNYSLVKNVWYHIAVVVDNTNQSKLFINGSQCGSGATVVDSGWAGYIGTNWADNAFLNGMIDEVRLSNTARYTTNFTPSTTPFVRDEYTKLLLHFDENGDDPRNTGKAIDDSGNGNHGTITGAKYVGGLIGVDGSSSNTSNQSNMSNQSYGSHEGVFIEEGTTNKITNPSFDHTTYNTNWSEMQFGDGADGAITVSTTKTIDTDTIATGRTYADAVNFGITTSIAAGATTINVGATPNGLLAGDEILVINLRDPTNADATNYGYAVQSTATAGSANTLTDSTKSWTTNAYATMTVAITSGTGQGQQRTVSSNDATTLTVSSNWTTNPDATSVYRVLDPNAWTNNIASIKVGQYETRYITSIATNTLTLDRALTNAYDGTVYKIMVQRVPQYTNVTVQSGGILTVSAYNNTNAKGGVLFFRANGTVTVDSGGSIDASGKGYGGGVWSNYGGPGGITYNGTGGNGASTYNANGNTGQGGGGGAHGTGTGAVGTTGGGGGGGGPNGGSGGAGGYGSVGTGGAAGGSSGSGTTGGNGSNRGAGGGGTYGLASLSQIYLGSGGGSGGCRSGPCGNGGNGGGMIFVGASGLTVNGSISANGNPGGNATVDGYGGGGGGGTGGSIYIKATTETLGSSIVTASGGSGGTETAGGQSPGGTGGVGRVRVESPSISGTTSPAASTSSTIGSLTATENTASNAAYAIKFGSKSTKLVATATASYTIGINPAAASSHTLSAYVYDGTSGNVGGTISASIAKLVFEGTPVTTGYTDMGGGWWRLSYAGTTTNATNQYGVQVLSGKTIYVDGVQLEEKAYATTYTDGTMGTGYAWTGTANDSTSTRTIARYQYSPSSNIDKNQGSISMWVKPNWVSNDNLGHTFFHGYNNYHFQLVKLGNNQIRFEIYSVGWGASLLVSSGPPSVWQPNTWHHVVARWNVNGDVEGTANIALDIDGTTYTGTTSNLANPEGISTFGIGTDNNSGSSRGESNSGISDFRIYNTPLTSTEVADLYYTGLGSHSSLAPVATERYTDGEPPVLAWHLNEGYGSTAYDTTIYQNSGTISGASWSNETYESYGTNKSLSFDGTNDYISRTYTNDPELAPGTSPFSVSTWFKHPSTVSGTDTLISRYSSTGSGGGYKVYMNSSGYICFGVDDDTTWGPDDSACTTVSYADSNWHHVLAIKGTSTIAVYIDGTQKASTTFTVSASLNGNTPTFYTGIDSDGTSNPWDGFIDEVRVYNSVRSEEQINQEYIAKGTNKGVSAQFGSPSTGSGRLADGLVGHWKMDEASGTLADSSGNNNTGTWSGTGSSHYTTGKYGNGGGFNGTDDYVTVPNSSSLNPVSAFTVSTWYKSGNTTVPGVSDVLVSKWDSATVGYELSVRFSGKTLCANIGGDQTLICGTTDIKNLQWHHLTAVYNGKSYRVFVDGVQEKITNNPALPGSGTGALAFGTRIPYYYSTSSLDDVRIYNRALSPVEVRALYEYAPGPVAYYTMDEGSGQSAYDKSGNSNTGTLGASSSVGSDDPTWTNGKYGKALSFDGGDYVNIPDNTYVSAGAGSWSVSAWAKAPNTNQLSPVVTKRQDTGVYEQWGLNICGTVNCDSSGKKLVALFRQDESIERRAVSNVDVVDGNWHYYSMVVDKSYNNIRLYMDGVELVVTLTTDSSWPTVDNTDPVRVGNNNGSLYFNGSIDDVRIYNYARSQKQIVMDMNAGHPAVGSPVGSAVAHYKFDEGQGTVARNYGNGGSALNGTLTNMSAPATSTSGWTNDGKFSKALNFDGSDDYVELGGTTAFANDTSGTISLWANNSGRNTENVLFGTSRNASATLTELVIDYDSRTINKKVWGVVAVDGVTQWSFYTTNFDAVANAGSWHNFMLVHNGTEPFFYIDGKLSKITYETSTNKTKWFKAILTDATNKADTTSLGTLRRNGGLVAPALVAIDEVKIYNYALSEDEVKLEYNQGAAIVFGAVGTNSTGTVAAFDAARGYCPPGNVEGNCAAGQNPAPVGEWNFDEGSGTSAADISGNNNTGSLTNGPTWTSGKAGKGLSFDGSNDYVNLGVNKIGPLINNAGASTINLWVKRSSTLLSGKYENVVYASRQASDNASIWINIRGDGADSGKILIGGRSQSTDAFQEATGPVLSAGVWYYVTGVLDYPTDTIKIFINGVLSVNASVSFGANSYIHSTPSIVYDSIGNNGAFVFYTGLVDQVRIYPYARTPAQIAWDYNKGAPVAHYKFDECTGTLVSNLAPASQGDSGNDATITIGAGGTQTSAGNCSSDNTAEAWNNGTTGKFNNSMSFDGTDDYASVASSANLPIGRNPRTVSFWMFQRTRVVDVSAASIDILNGGSGQSYTVGTNLINSSACINAGSSPSVFIFTDSVNPQNNICLQGSQIPSLNQWHHISFSFDGVSSWVYYLDGQRMLSGTFGATINTNTTGINIGRRSSTVTGYFNGQIDDVRIYNYALSDQQVKLLYNNASAVNFK